MTITESPMPVRPMSDGDRRSPEYWAAAAEGKLLIGHCNACDTNFHPIQHECPFCWSSEIAFVPASGHGEIDSFSIVHRNESPFFKARVPYAVAWIRLKEGPCLMSNIVDSPIDKIAIGASVSVEFEQVADQVAVPLFRLSPQG